MKKHSFPTYKDFIFDSQSPHFAGDMWELHHIGITAGDRYSGLRTFTFYRYLDWLSLIAKVKGKADHLTFIPSYGQFIPIREDELKILLKSEKLVVLKGKYDLISDD